MIIIFVKKNIVFLFLVKKGIWINIIFFKLKMMNILIKIFYIDLDLFKIIVVKIFNEIVSV